MYNKPSGLDHRATSFGYGKRYELIHFSKNNPDPSLYNIHSIFNNPKAKGFTFGASRSNFTKVVIPGQIQTERNVPGPGTYNHQDELSKIKFSIKKIIPPTKFSLNVPGPGTYSNNLTISKEGRFPFSSFTNCSTKKFDPTSSKRFLEFKKTFPGPGHYSHEGTQMNAKMSHILSHYFNSGRCPTTRTKRILFKFDKYVNPGPGAYTLLSEFAVKPKMNQFESKIMTRSVTAFGSRNSGKSKNTED